MPKTKNKINCNTYLFYKLICDQRIYGRRFKLKKVTPKAAKFFV